MSFKEYYEYYLTLHQNRISRRLHFIGQCATQLVLVAAAVLKSWLLLLLAPFVVYPFAWTGHFLFEKNKPAAFSRPLWVKACDWVMMKDVITGRIEW